MTIKTFLGISLPIAIVVLIFSLFARWETIGVISILYIIIAGIFWKFAKHL